MYSTTINNSLPILVSIFINYIHLIYIESTIRPSFKMTMHITP